MPSSTLSSGSISQILRRLGVNAEISEQCATIIEVHEDLGITTTPELVVESLAELTTPKYQTHVSSLDCDHPDPFFSAVNYNSKRYGITAKNNNLAPPFVFQDWRNADECQSGNYQILEAWDTKCGVFLSPKEIQAKLQNQSLT